MGILIKIWDILGIEPTDNTSEVKKAYAKKLKIHNPEDDPESFQQLREAYEGALKYIKNLKDYEAQYNDDEDEIVNEGLEFSHKNSSREDVEEKSFYTNFSDTFLDQVQNIYDDLSLRNSIESWRALLDSEVMWDINNRELISHRMIDFLFQNYHLPCNIWQLLDSYFHWSEDDGAFSALVKNDLCSAVDYEDLEIVKRVLENGADIEAVNNENMTPLIAAAAYGYLDIVELLLENGANIEARDDNYQTALFRAVENDYLDIAEYLMDKGANIHIRKDEEWTLLMSAAYDGYLELVKCLVERGVLINEVRDGDDTALSYAILHGHREVVEYLLGYGANKPEMDIVNSSSIGLLDRVKYLVEVLKVDLEKRNSESNTALHMAAKYGHFNIAEYLLEKGAYIDAKGEFGVTPLMTATFHYHYDIMDMLVKHGANLEENIGFPYYTILAWCASKEHYDALEYFINCGANIDIKDSISGDTPFMTAIKEGKIHLMKYLLEKGADINAKNDYGDTALLRAVDEDNLEALKFLLKKGVDINCKNNEGYNPILSAAARGQLEMMKYLLKNGFTLKDKTNRGSTPLIVAAEGNNLNIIKFIIKEYVKTNKIDINERNYNGETALMSAARIGLGRIKVVKYLAQNGADLTLIDNEGQTALMLAARYDNPEIVEYLLENNADINELDIILSSCVGLIDRVKYLVEKENQDINAADKNGRTPLIGAANYNKIEVVKYLLEKGANTEAKDEDKDGKTALIIAADWGHLEMVKMLVENKADINARDNMGKTAIMYAAKKWDKGMAKYLLEKGADIEAVDNDGNSVLMVAANHGYGTDEFVKYLVDKGAFVNRVNNDGVTTLMFAVMDKSLENVEFFVKNGVDMKLRDKQGKTALDYAKECECNDIARYLSMQLQQIIQ